MPSFTASWQQSGGPTMPVHNHGSDPHTYYCAECRTTYEFDHAPGCTCSRVQEFVVMHRNSHADTKRPQINTPVNIRSAEKLGLTEPISPIYVGMYD
jgi:hypothetical protein